MLSGNHTVRGCPEQCLIRLTSNQALAPHGSVLHQASSIEKMIPRGFRRLTPSHAVYCVSVNGDCGASVPVYRYYRLTHFGIHHAYSFSNQEIIDQYSIEESPICYGWKVVPEDHDGTRHDSHRIDIKSNELKKDKGQSSPSQVCTTNSSISDDALVVLNVFENKRPASFHDHYYTTMTSMALDPDHGSYQLSGYTLKDQLGRVAKSRAGCGCLIEMRQMVDSQDGIFARIDHKFVEISSEEDKPNEHYRQLEEYFYCAPRENACGATLPLRKFFHITDIDSLYTANDTISPVGAVQYPSEVLCYMWELDESNEKDYNLTSHRADYSDLDEDIKADVSTTTVQVSTTQVTPSPPSHAPYISFYSSARVFNEDCAALPTVANGAVVYSTKMSDSNGTRFYGLDTIARLTCASGFTHTSDVKKLICLRGSQWFPEPNFKPCSRAASDEPKHEGTGNGAVHMKTGCVTLIGLDEVMMGKHKASKSTKESLSKSGATVEQSSQTRLEQDVSHLQDSIEKRAQLDFSSRQHDDESRRYHQKSAPPRLSRRLTTQLVQAFALSNTSSYPTERMVDMLTQLSLEQSRANPSMSPHFEQISISSRKDGSSNEKVAGTKTSDFDVSVLKINDKISIIVIIESTESDGVMSSNGPQTVTSQPMNISQKSHSPQHLDVVSSHSGNVVSSHSGNVVSSDTRIVTSVPMIVAEKSPQTIDVTSSKGVKVKVTSSSVAPSWDEHWNEAFITGRERDEEEKPDVRSVTSIPITSDSSTESSSRSPQRSSTTPKASLTTSEDVSTPQQSLMTSKGSAVDAIVSSTESVILSTTLHSRKEATVQMMGETPIVSTTQSPDATTVKDSTRSTDAMPFVSEPSQKEDTNMTSTHSSVITPSSELMNQKKSNQSSNPPAKNSDRFAQNTSASAQSVVTTSETSTTDASDSKPLKHSTVPRHYFERGSPFNMVKLSRLGKMTKKIPSSAYSHTLLNSDSTDLWFSRGIGRSRKKGADSLRDQETSKTKSSRLSSMVTLQEEDSDESREQSLHWKNSADTTASVSTKNKTHRQDENIAVKLYLSPRFGKYWDNMKEALEKQKRICAKQARARYLRIISRLKKFWSRSTDLKERSNKQGDRNFESRIKPSLESVSKSRNSASSPSEAMSIVKPTPKRDSVLVSISTARWLSKNSIAREGAKDMERQTTPRGDLKIQVKDGEPLNNSLVYYSTAQILPHSKTSTTSKDSDRQFNLTRANGIAKKLP